MEITVHSYNLLKSINTILAYSADLSRNIFWHNFGLTVSIIFFIINKFITTYLKKLKLIFEFIIIFLINGGKYYKIYTQILIYSFFDN